MRTDAPHRSLRRVLHEHSRSVRTRITAWVVLLTGIALAAVGVTSYVIELNQVDEDIASGISQEMREFETLRQEGIDPETGRDFASAERLLDVALERNSPEAHELLLVVVPGRDARGLYEGELTAADQRAMLRAVQARLPDGGTGTVETSRGEVAFGVKPVSDGAVTAAYVVGYFRDAETAIVVATMRTYALIAVLAVLLVAVGAWLTAGRLLDPIRQLRDTAREISDHDLSRRIEVEGNDDLAELASTFNAMLDRLEDAFGTQRRFLDDAGHELRTPITIVRGHLEVADPSNPADVESTRTLVLDELDRMGRLVDDLIVLAKAGQPDFVRRAQIDAGALTDHVLEKVRALGDRHWVLDMRADWLVHGDAQRITQAVVQLAKNAVQHTRPGDEIGIGSAVQHGQVGWWVRDTGPGVQRADAERIFDRFQRGHQARGHDGSGLGLSIVKAIAHAHGGDVYLVSEPGQGATFSLVFPLQPDDVEYVATVAEQEELTP